MSFIGIISDYKCFEKLNQEINNRFKNSIKLIHINKNSIGNIKNIKFEAIIIEEDLKKFQKEILIIEKICNKANYIIINTDINTDINSKVKDKTITYGCNHNAMITISSVTDTDILICLQKEIKNKKGKLMEIGEKHVKIKENSRLKIEDFLIIESIFLIKNYSIIEEI